MLQRLPEAALSYSALQRSEIVAAVAATSRLWRRMGSDFDASYAKFEPSLLAVLFAAQERIADGALAYVPDVLDEVGGPVGAPLYESAGSRFVGVAGDGLPVASMAYGAVIQAKMGVAAGLSLALHSHALGSTSRCRLARCCRIRGAPLRRFLAARTA